MYYVVRNETEVGKPEVEKEIIGDFLYNREADRFANKYLVNLYDNAKNKFENVEVNYYAKFPYITYKNKNKNIKIELRIVYEK